MAFREFLRSYWHVVTIAVTAGVLVCAALFLFSNLPPRSIAMATGPEGGGYYEIGRQYQELLARNGVELRLVATAGSLENLALLRDPKSGVDIALVQGDSVGKETGELESLGTLFCGSSTAAAWRAGQWPPYAVEMSRSDPWQRLSCAPAPSAQAQ